MPVRAICFLAAFLFGSTLAVAASTCPIPPSARKTTSNIADWYEKYVSPFRVFAGAKDVPRPSKEEVEAFAEKIVDFHQRSISDVLQFETLVQQITNSYARAGDFKGLNAGAAEKIYRPGPSLDFSAMCIDSRTIKFPDDAFGVTLFGVKSADCERSRLRGLVFTETLVNGAVDGPCRPDDTYYKNLFIPFPVGTNVVTFVCGKETNGCTRR